MRKKQRGISIRVTEGFYELLERERRNFMKQQGLNNLSSVAFTGVMEKRYKQSLGLGEIKNVKKKFKKKS